MIIGVSAASAIAGRAHGLDWPSALPIQMPPWVA